MTAMVFVTSGATSALSLYGVLCMIPILLLWSPQHVRRDKRVLVGAALVIVAALGFPALAADSKICEICPWWLCIECLYYGS